MEDQEIAFFFVYKIDSIFIIIELINKQLLIMHTKANRQKKKLKKMDEVMKLQLQVAEIAEENKKKVAALQAKFEKVEKEAYDECPVCYGSISVKNTCCMPNCDHKMCKNCYYNWLDKQEKNTCPMCREEVFKNNLDIKTKRGVLQEHLDSLESEVADLYHERRHIRKSIRDTQDELAQVDHDVSKLYDKHDQLRDEIFDKKQILDEIREYERHHDSWKKKRKQRLRKLIRTGRIVWRTNIKNVHKELFQKNFSWLEDELAVREEFKPCSDDEVDISELNMFELPPEFAGDETRITMGTYHIWENGVLSGNNRVVLKEGEIDEIDWDSYEYINWGDTDDEDETGSMPELIDATNQELEDMALEGTEIEEGEIVEPPTLTRVNRRLIFDYTDFQNALDRFNSGSVTAQLNDDIEDRSIGEVTGRSARV